MTVLPRRSSWLPMGSWRKNCSRAQLYMPRSNVDLLCRLGTALETRVPARTRERGFIVFGRWIIQTDGLSSNEVRVFVILLRGTGGKRTARRRAERPCASSSFFDRAEQKLEDAFVILLYVCMCRRKSEND